MVMRKMQLYPWAKIHEEVRSGVRPFIGFPKGITIHYTAGASAISSINYLRTTELAYHFVIDRNGDVYQMTYLSDQVYHAGNSLWNHKSPNRNHIAIALANWGKLTATDQTYYSHTGKTISSSSVNFGQNNYNMNEGFYESVTKQQVHELERLCLYLCSALSITPLEICGHDECSLGRKTDPGACLPYSMSEMRQHLYNKLSSSRKLL